MLNVTEINNTDEEEDFIMNQYLNAAQGLKKMFIAQIGIIICTVVDAIGIVGLAIGTASAMVFASGSLAFMGVFGILAILAGIGAVVFAVISLVGLYGAGKDIAGCNTAFTVTIVSLVVSVLGILFRSSTILSLLFSLAGFALSFQQTYFVCTSVSEVMSVIGAQDIANQGNSVWKIYLACSIIQAVIAVMGLIPVLNLLTGIGSIVNVIVSLIGLIMYMVFLQKSYKALGA